MDPNQYARTIEERLDALAPDRPTARSPKATLRPAARTSWGGQNALHELRRLGGAIDDKLSLLSPLGEGGMGVVHLAAQTTVGRHVAVKKLKAPDASPEAELRLLREAWVTGALEHPNVVPVYDVGVDGQGAPVIVMKRVEGRPWSELLRCPEELARLVGEDDALAASLRVFVTVCNAVHFAHSRGIIHRDIKPENVMIGAFGEVYVLDWGIAVSLRDDPSGRLPPLANATDPAGTPAYMAPEMLLGDPAMLSERTDVFLLGATLYELFAGEPPHGGATLHEVLARALVAEPAYPDGFAPEVRAICERAMQRLPAGRFESADAVREAVEEFRRHRGSRRLAREAEQSLDVLLRTLAHEPPSEERALAVFNLLGECRFGFRAALTAWPGNAAAREGLDRALLGVVEHEIVEGDPQAAALLLREVSAPPPELAARIDAAQRARADEDERLRRFEADHDPAVGARTRMFLGTLFGAMWTSMPLTAWAMSAAGRPPGYRDMLYVSLAFACLSLSLGYWARESLSKTLLNRRYVLTVTLHFVVQLLLIFACWLAGLTPWQGQWLHVLAWTMLQSLLAIWVEPWLALSAAVSALTFVVAVELPSALFPLMAVDNLVVTAVLFRVWLPKQDLDSARARQRAFKRRARALFLDIARGPGRRADAP